MQTEQDIRYKLEIESMFIHFSFSFELEAMSLLSRMENKQ